MITAIHNGTRTSAIAAHSLTGAAAQRETILAELRAAGVNGLTRQELETKTGIRGDAIRPRVWQLMRDGLVEESGASRQTESGKPAMVLVVR